MMDSSLISLSPDNFRLAIFIHSSNGAQASAIYFYLSRTLGLCCLVRCWHGFSHVIILFPDITILETFELIYHPVALLPILFKQAFAEELLLYIRMSTLSSVVLFHRMSP